MHTFTTLQYSSFHNPRLPSCRKKNTFKLGIFGQCAWRSYLQLRLERCKEVRLRHRFVHGRHETWHDAGLRSTKERFRTGISAWIQQPGSDPPWIETEAEKIYYFAQADVIRPTGLLRDLLDCYNMSTTRKDINNDAFFEPHSLTWHCIRKYEPMSS